MGISSAWGMTCLLVTLFPRLMPSNLGSLGENLWRNLRPYKLPQGEMIIFLVTQTLLLWLWNGSMLLGKRYKKEKEIKITVLNKKQSQSAVSRNRAIGILSLSLWVRGSDTGSRYFFPPFVIRWDLGRGAMKEQETYGLGAWLGWESWLCRF